MANSVFQNRIKSNKTLLYVISGVICVVDLFLAIMLGISGDLAYAGNNLIWNLLLDLFLVLGVYLSNFRLKYSRKYPIWYMIFTLF